jgi:hypothetical protein
MTRPWRAAVAAAGLPADLVPYCLPHSSIVRGLRAGLPVRLVVSFTLQARTWWNAATVPLSSVPMRIVCAEPLCQWLQRMLPASVAAEPRGRDVQHLISEQHRVDVGGERRVVRNDLADALREPRRFASAAAACASSLPPANA